VHFWYNFYLLFLNSERVAEQHSCIQETKMSAQKTECNSFSKKWRLGGLLGG
jgi:hypothetical protein